MLWWHSKRKVKVCETLAIEKEYAPLEHIPGAYSVGK
jgi:hypothetical protein